MESPARKATDNCFYPCQLGKETSKKYNRQNKDELRCTIMEFLEEPPSYKRKKEDDKPKNKT